MNMASDFDYLTSERGFLSLQLSLFWLNKLEELFSQWLRELISYNFAYRFILGPQIRKSPQNFTAWFVSCKKLKFQLFFRTFRHTISSQIFYEM